MILFFVCFICTTYFAVVPVYTNPMKNSDNYGPVAISELKLEPCPMLKASKLSSLNISLDTSGIALINITLFEKQKLESLKVSVHNVTQGHKSFLWNYKIKDPCKHLVYASIVKSALMADNNCNIKPGIYRNQLNVKDVMTTVFGSSFFYGSYFTKSDLSTKNGAIACFSNSFVLTKK